MSSGFVDILTEVYGHDTLSQIYSGDALSALDHWLKHHRGKVDLIYLDPPRPSKNRYGFTQRIGAKGYLGDTTMRIKHTFADDTFAGFEAYLSSMEQILQKCRSLLSPTGSIYVHTGQQISAHIRLLLDRVFGRSRFTNEIIWAYPSSSHPVSHFVREHDTIFSYRQGKSCYFDGQIVGELRGIERRNHMKKNIDRDGRVYYSMQSGGKEYRYYEDDVIIPGDVWDDIAPLQPKDREYTGYDTQKPEALLERIILSSCPEGGLVCDPFSGSGTTAAVAAKHHRHILCCDHNFHAAHLTRRRLNGCNASFNLTWNNSKTTQPLPIIELSVENFDSYQKVTITNYRQKSGEPYYEVSLLPREYTLVDWWAVGHRMDDKLYISDIAMRSADHPDFERRLRIPHGTGIPCAIVVDVFGGRFSRDL